MCNEDKQSDNSEEYARSFRIILETSSQVWGKYHIIKPNNKIENIPIYHGQAAKCWFKRTTANENQFNAKEKDSRTQKQWNSLEFKN
jgi:hypothetical protein